MSLHAQLSPEAIAELQKRQRSSTIMSIVISVLIIALIVAVLAIWFLPSLVKENPVIVGYSSPNPIQEEVVTKKPTTRTPRKPSAPSSASAKVITSQSTAPTAVPTPDIEVTDPAVDFGSGDDFGEGWGSSGDGDGGGGGNIPATMSKRCSKEDRMQRLANNGGNEECEKSVEKALQWLKSTQNDDGSWATQHKGAMTGFAILAYLGRCETPMSAEYGQSCTDGILYLINLAMENDGRLAQSGESSNQWVYEHGIATYALAEALTFCNQLGINIPNLEETVKTAGDMIIGGQTEAGGWLYRYASGGGGDNSVGFWQIQALKACKLTGLWDEKVMDKTSRKALEWLSNVQGENGAIGYRSSPSRSPGLTGGGVLAFQMWGKPKASEVRKGIDWIVKNDPFEWDDANLYYHYYHAQAMINWGGKEWKDYNDQFRDALIENQAEDGSWPGYASHGNHGPINVHMGTCLATFMLEVYYRFLPATGGGS